MLIQMISEQMHNFCPKTKFLAGERILIFGGSGSLGRTTIKRWVSENRITSVSRDEERQWQLKTHIMQNHNIKDNHFSQIIGDISNQEDVDYAILTTKPTVICIFACLKHIDICEKFPRKSLAINANGVMNVYNTLLKHQNFVHTVLFVSTDKACLPITTYGCSKAVAEFFLQGIPFNGTKWVGVRYGNVLNSSGSIIPYLKSGSTTEEPYTLTHPEMTRFIMTLEQSVNLIEHAIVHGKHNEIIIPNICSMRIQDLFEIFEDKYNKHTVITGLRCHEKIHEDLLSVSEASKAYKKDNYYHISKTVQNMIDAFDSSKCLIEKNTLREYLQSLDLI